MIVLLKGKGGGKFPSSQRKTEGSHVNQEYVAVRRFSEHKKRTQPKTEISSNACEDKAELTQSRSTKKGQFPMELPFKIGLVKA